MSINKVILMGNAGADAELRETTAGTSVAKFRLATTERWKNKAGEYEDNTEWHTIRAWRSTADYVGRNVKKGTTVAVVGKLTTESWETASGEKRYQAVIEADEISIVKRDGTTDQREEKSEPEQKPAQRPLRPKPQVPQLDEQSDDLPF